ncbi:hypothetical protein KL86CLO1_13191 [uncultured Eubacteriales bacterium]|uniref:Uncharacterized protein n=1 Tax=uncultured Eubacteriales bacterium TaxID=172733 RepID=A0A212KHK4_9FIRM|nr:hypothetical protein KL86CLO1_13191 [uncultured Eubacteriales bacterium]
MRSGFSLTFAAVRVTRKSDELCAVCIRAVCIEGIDKKFPAQTGNLFIYAQYHQKEVN